MVWYNDELDASHYRQEDVDEIINIARKMEVKTNKRELYNLIYYNNIVLKNITNNTISNNSSNYNNIIDIDEGNSGNNNDNNILIYRVLKVISDDDFNKFIDIKLAIFIIRKKQLKDEQDYIAESEKLKRTPFKRIEYSILSLLPSKHITWVWKNIQKLREILFEKVRPGLFQLREDELLYEWKRDGELYYSISRFNTTTIYDKHPLHKK